MKALLFALLVLAGDAAADAAVKAQEGSVDQWIEYYARDRAKAVTPAAKPAVKTENGTAAEHKDNAKK